MKQKPRVASGSSFTATKLTAPLLPVAGYSSLAAVTAATYVVLASKLTAAWMAPALLAWTVGLPTFFNAQQLAANGGPGVAESMGGYEADARLTALARNAAIAVGVDPPKYVYEIPRREPNAFAASGFGSSSTTVAVTSGLRKLLTPAELSAVLAHEMGHIKHRDVGRNMHLLIVTAGLSGIFETGRILLDSERTSESDDDESGGGAVIGLGLMGLGLCSQGIAHLVQLAASRGAELRADSAAAEAFGGACMISALTKIDRAAATQPTDLRDGKEGRQLAFAMISDGASMQSAIDSERKPNAWTSAMSHVGRALRTHPPTEERIEALESAMLNGDVPRVAASPSRSALQAGSLWDPLGISDAGGP